MELNLGQKIRELRRENKRTQEDLADAIGVTPQAVSRWESGGGYPDMEIIPSIANYFEVTIDELFGYDNNRDNKIRTIVNKINSFNIKSRSDEDWIEECIGMLRKGLLEFPQNEILLFHLADTLAEAGWRRYKEWLYYDEEGFLQNNYEIHKNNEYWKEAISICEYLFNNSKNTETINNSINLLVVLFRNIGEEEKSVFYAEKLPPFEECKEFALVKGTSGKNQAKHIGNCLIKLVKQFSKHIVYGLMVNKNHFDSDFPIKKIKGAIDLFDLICENGDLGTCHGDLVDLYLYLSRIEWERGYHDDAFVSLDKSLKHAKVLERICNGEEYSFTSPMISFVKQKTQVNKDIAKSVPNDWPMWNAPDCSQVAKEIASDSRWHDWVAKTQL